MSKEKNIDEVPFRKVEKCLESIRFHFKDEPERLDDVVLTFEYVMASFFPNIFNNVKEAMAQEYIRGFNEGCKTILAE